MSKVELEFLDTPVPSKEEIWQNNISFLDERFLYMGLEYDVQEIGLLGKSIKRFFPTVFHKLQYAHLVPEDPPSAQQAIAVYVVFSSIPYAEFRNDAEARILYDGLREEGIRFEHIERDKIRKSLNRMIEDEMDNVETTVGERFEEVPTVELIKAESFHKRVLEYVPKYGDVSVVVSPYIKAVTCPLEKKILMSDRNIVAMADEMSGKSTEAEQMRIVDSKSGLTELAELEMTRKYYDWEIHELHNSLFEELVHALHFQKRGEWGERVSAITEKGMVLNIAESLAQVTKERGLGGTEPERRYDVFVRSVNFWTNKHSFSTYRAMLGLAEKYDLMKICMFDWIDCLEIINPTVSRILLGGPKIRVGISADSEYRLEMVKDVLENEKM